MKIGIILGTRPEIIKMSPLIDEINKRNHECIIIHTGQHYDLEMSKQFFIDLNLALPDYNIGTGSNTALKQISITLSELEKILVKEDVDIVLVQGDTNTVLAGALTANKLKIPVGHVEAGLRSFDKNMPEEINRIIADNCSNLYFVPTKETAINLQNEGINHEFVHVTGNTIVDACKRNLSIALENSSIENIVEFDEFIVLTLHRAENVDNPKKLRSIVNSLINLDYNIVFPLHPHTRKSLEETSLYEKINMASNIQITKPLGYLDFLCLLSKSKLILTDSGGIQEEAVTLNIPCITLRNNTERPETVDAGANVLTGTEERNIIYNVENILSNNEVYEKMASSINPYGNGDSSKIICEIIEEKFENSKLSYREYDNITDFKGYFLEEISDDITVEEFEKMNDSVIEQIFSNGLPEYIDNKSNLKGKIIIFKKFE